VITDQIHRRYSRKAEGIKYIKCENVVEFQLRIASTKTVTAKLRPVVIYYLARESILRYSTYYTPISKILMTLNFKEKFQISDPDKFFFFYGPR